MKVFAPELSALITIFRSVGPVISTLSTRHVSHETYDCPCTAFYNLRKGVCADRDERDSPTIL